MDSLLNASRPTVFCPGCSHDRVLHALNRALTQQTDPENNRGGSGPIAPAARLQSPERSHGVKTWPG